jgi:transporter family-2 protein
MVGIARLRPYPDRVSGTFIAFALASLAGLMVTVQAQMLGVVETKYGPYVAGAVTFILGGVIGAVILAMIRPDFSEWRAVPWWAWLGGLAGLAVVTGISFAIPRIGISPTLTIVIAAQLVVAVVLEHFGLLGVARRPLDARVVGIAIVALGSWITIR